MTTSLRERLFDTEAVSKETKDGLLVATHNAAVRNIKIADELNGSPISDDTIRAVLAALQQKGLANSANLATQGKIRDSILMKLQAQMLDQFIKN